jgi:hypothetical protein
MGTGASTGVSNEFNLPQIEHFKIPLLTTLVDGTGTLLQWGGANADWVEASGRTYNLVEKIDTIISTILLRSSSPPPQLTCPMSLGQSRPVSIVLALRQAVQVPQELLPLLQAHPVSTKEEAEVAGGR